MNITVSFYSYFKDLTGTAGVGLTVPDGSTIRELHGELAKRFPKLKAMEKSILTAVDVDYQGQDYVLREGDQVSLFPPVQGG